MKKLKEQLSQLKNAKWNQITLAVVLIFLTLSMVFKLLLSLKWRMVHDAPQMNYIAFLIDRFNYVPYRDFFVTSLPGTFFFHLFIGKVFGYGDLPLRCMDIVLLLLLSMLSWHIFKPFGKRVAWAGIVLFGLSYLQLGECMCLQRDYIGILPIVAAIYTGTSNINLRRWFKILLIGILFGISAIIKPHLSIGLPIVIGYMSINHFRQFKKESGSSFIPIIVKDILLASSGYIIPVMITLYWLSHLGALPYFWETVSTYMRLHLEQTANHEMISGSARFLYLIRGYTELGGLTGWLIPASLGLYISLFENEYKSKERHFLIFLAIMVFAYSIYPAFAGQFWAYHWIPFQYFIVITAGLIFVTFQNKKHRLSKHVFQLITVLFTIFFLLGSVHLSIFDEIINKNERIDYSAPRIERAETIATFLKSRLKPGDSVQPLDWTGGSHHALLMAEARLATPYMYDYYFYHHISHPYIQVIRNRFIDRLYQEKPRFIVEITKKPRIWGKDTTTEFPALRSFIQDYYEDVLKGDGFIIYERKL